MIAPKTLAYYKRSIKIAAREGLILGILKPNEVLSSNHIIPRLDNTLEHSFNVPKVDIEKGRYFLIKSTIDRIFRQERGFVDFSDYYCGVLQSLFLEIIHEPVTFTYKCTQNEPEYQLPYFLMKKIMMRNISSHADISYYFCMKNKQTLALQNLGLEHKGKLLLLEDDPYSILIQAAVLSLIHFQTPKYEQIYKLKLDTWLQNNPLYLTHLHDARRFYVNV